MTTTDLAVAGSQALSFTVRGPWAHFRRIDSTTEKLTYRVIPRTTVAGLIAAILGRPRDSYYDTFAPDASAIAITPQSALETMAIPMLTLPTEEGDIKTAEGVSGKTVIDPNVIEAERKRRTFEYVVDPSYRIDVVLDDDATFTELREALENSRYTYTPSLGKSECLASIDDVAVTTVEPVNGATAIDSIVPEARVVPSPGTRWNLERTPAYMMKHGDGRRTTGYLSYAFASDGGRLTVDGGPAHTVGERTVCFI